MRRLDPRVLKKWLIAIAVLYLVFPRDLVLDFLGRGLGMSEYHPDKVAHLGEELQELAHRKALEIQQAYQQLRK